MVELKGKGASRLTVDRFGARPDGVNLEQVNGRGLRPRPSAGSSSLRLEESLYRDEHTARRISRRRLRGTRLLVISDCIAALTLTAAVSVIPHGVPRGLEATEIVAATLSAAFAAPVCLAAVGGYGQDGWALWRGRYSLGQMAFGASLFLWIMMLVAAVTGFELNLVQLTSLCLLLALAWACGRTLVCRRVGGTERVLIIGSGRVAQQLAELCRRHPDRGLEVVGYVDDEPAQTGPAPPVLGGVGNLSSLISSCAVDRVIVAFSRQRDEEIVAVLRACDHLGVPVDIVPRLFELMGVAPKTSTLEGLPLVTVSPPPQSVSQRVLKRCLDVLLSALLLLLTAPVFIVITIAILVNSGRPVFFRQLRVGKDGREFSIWKFRTMIVEAEDVSLTRVAELENESATIAQAVESVKLESIRNLTSGGRVLRRYSLDELPQLVNVLTGDMSLVGPRPLRPFEVDTLTEWQLSRLHVRPGLTGLWQVMGRSEVPWDERMQLDYSYVRHQSLSSDLLIVAKTLPAVFRSKGAL